MNIILCIVKLIVIHIFQNYKKKKYIFIKKSRKKNKKHYFDEFQEYLKGVSSSKLAPFAKQLENEGLSVNTKPIYDWLAQVKGNSSKFVNSLRESIE